MEAGYTARIKALEEASALFSSEKNDLTGKVGHGAEDGARLYLYFTTGAGVVYGIPRTGASERDDETPACRAPKDVSLCSCPLLGSLLLGIKIVSSDLIL